MRTVKDKFGIEIEPGDTILYATQYASTANIKFAIVTKIHTYPSGELAPYGHLLDSESIHRVGSGFNTIVMRKANGYISDELSSILG